MKISVIIPIYNTEEYLRECIDSVLSQTYQDLEVLLVDDGSTDSSWNICKDYENDPRVICLHKENGGLSSARNFGLKYATGDYVLFLDSDDYYNRNDALEKLVRRISESKADVLNFSYVKYFEDLSSQKPYFEGKAAMPLSCHEKVTQVRFLMENSLYIASACNKMIRRELFLRYPLQFEKGVHSEDIEWCCRLLLFAESLDFICESFYMYRQRSTSISHNISSKKCSDVKKHIITCIQLANRADQEIRHYFYQYAAYQFGTFVITQSMAEEWQKELIRELASYRWILKYHGKNKKLICLRFLSMLMGYTNLCRLIYCLKKRKNR